MFTLILKLAKSRTARKVAKMAAKKVRENVEFSIVDRDLEIDAFGHSMRVRETASGMANKVRERRGVATTTSAMDLSDWDLGR